VDPQAYSFHGFDQGGFASHAVCQEDFLYPIPDAMSTADAAPMMCAGMTVFTPLARYGVQATDRVGVVGIGALGHLAIQFASKMGCDVVAFSGTVSKEAEAKALGARTFVSTAGKKELKLEGKPINHLLVTSSRFPDWNQ
jgi:D-arabinose 1-dehydrogenase-like Zn-dependent alcohol dehydrogenase